MSAATASRLPVGRIAAIYLAALPAAGFAAAAGVPWELAVAAIAAGLSWLVGLPPWWLAINALFVPALSFGLSLDIGSGWALAALVGLLLFYGRIWKSRVPLFFSTARAVDALARLLPAGPVRFLDLGCGDARVIARLAASRAGSRFDGVEQALVPWLMARVRCRMAQGDCAVVRGDLWAADLSQYDVVYAYLSPAVMPRLWEKAQREMRPGTKLVSAFAVPGVTADREIDVGDAMDTRLHVWTMRAGPR
ncbi:MAG TPA: class I SAM-dependent methyltransferase [Burkholderiales bacterium]|nr:class I SAM-dependent methyltransferase [Burkholderiales bacterium]